MEEDDGDVIPGHAVCGSGGEQALGPPFTHKHLQRSNMVAWYFPTDCIMGKKRRRQLETLMGGEQGMVVSMRPAAI